MYGAMIGDIVGSKYEFDNIKTKDFPLFSPDCDYTDDSIMTVAVAKAILLRREAQVRGEARPLREILITTMQDFGRRYPSPKGSYGSHFALWLQAAQPAPYQSYGNGAAMRVSPCGLAAVTLEEALTLARGSAGVSHDHPEGIRGAEAVAAAVFLAKTGASKPEIRRYLSEHYYNLDFTPDDIRPGYTFDASCQGSVPPAVVCFLDSDSFEDAIRNVVSLGGDCDTTGAITGSIAWTWYAAQAGGAPDPAMQAIRAQACSYLPAEFTELADAFRDFCHQRAEAYARTGRYTPISDETQL